LFGKEDAAYYFYAHVHLHLLTRNESSIDSEKMSLACWSFQC